MADDARLRVVIDGTPMSEDLARALWDRFSAHMDAHPGDLAGFAKAEGFASVHPTAEGGRALLRVSRTEAQLPYGARALPSPGGGSRPGSTRGSPTHQAGRGRRKQRG
jgi:hypothetical protein